jgi:cysteine desulfurase
MQDSWQIADGQYIYLDHGATTPVRVEVVEAMRPYWTQYYGNPSSIHRPGQAARRALEQARDVVAEALNAEPDEIIFTGGGSESDNLALRGVMWAARRSGRGNHFITCAIEHKAVLETAYQLRDLYGFDLTVLPVNGSGGIDLAELEASIRPGTVLISIMAANNEVGTLLPLVDIGEIAYRHGVLLHTDAVQAAAVTHWDVRAMPIDLLSLSAHKFYGPKGIGILYASHEVDLVPALSGGDQEDGRRAGTANVPGAVGAAEALRLTVTERESNIAHYRQLRDRLIDGIIASFPEDCVLTGHPVERLPNHASFAFRNVGGNDLLIHLDLARVAASSGSACLTGDPEPSAVLQAMGLSPDWTKGGLRLTVGKQNTLEEIEYVIKILPEIVEKARSFSTV